MKSLAIVVFGLLAFGPACLLLAEIKMPNNEAIPDTVLEDPVSGKQGWMMWACAEGFQPLESWLPGAKPVTTTPKLKFMEPCFLLRVPYQAPGEQTNNWVLIGKKMLGEARDLRAKEVWGWVPEPILLEQSESLRNARSGIHHKVLMVNDPGKAKLDTKSLGLLMDQPFPSALARVNLKLYDPLFVYKMVPREDNARFLLVGTTPKFESDNRSAILGWVDNERTDIVRWNTRQGIEWTSELTWPDVDGAHRRTVPAEIIDSIEGNYAKFYPQELAAKGVTSPPAARTLFPEAFTKVSDINWREELPPPLRPRFQDLASEKPSSMISRGFRPMHMRPPLLDTAKEVDESNDPDDPWKLGRAPKRLRNELLHVGGIGGRNRLSAQEIDTIRAQAFQLIGDLREIEILFLVDRTGSMDKYFKDVATVIEEITNDAISNQRKIGGKVRVAVAMYDDRETDVKGKQRDTPMIIVSEMSEVSKSGVAIAKKVREQVAVGGGDPGEEMVQGIVDSVSQLRLQFSPWSYKMIVLLTDDGDRVAQKETNEERRLASEREEMNKVRAAIVPKTGAPFELFILQVKDPDNTDASVSLQRQIGYLQKAQSNWIPDSTRQLISTKVIGREGNVVTAIRARYEQAKLDVESKVEQMKSLASSAPIDIGPEVRRIFQAATGKSLDQYLAKSEETQVFKPGYIWKFPRGREAKGNEQVRISVLLSKVELNKIVKFVDDLVNDAEQTSVQEALQKLIAAVSGNQKYQDILAAKGEGGVLTGNDIARAKLGIEFQSPIFELDPMKLDQRLSRQDIEIVKYRLTVLQGIVADEAYTFKETTSNNAGEDLKKWQKSEVHVWKRFFSRYPGEDAQWCWIREDEIP